MDSVAMTEPASAAVSAKRKAEAELVRDETSLTQSLKEASDACGVVLRLGARLQVRWVHEHDDAADGEDEASPALTASPAPGEQTPAWYTGTLAGPAPGGRDADGRPLWRLNYEAAHGHAAESRVVAIYGKSLLVDYGDAGAEEAGDAAAEGKGAGAGAGHAATGGGSASPSRAEGLVEAAEEPGSGETVVNTPDGGNGSDDDGSDDEEEDALDVLAWRLEGDAAEPPQLLRASSSVMVQAEAEGHWEHGLVVGPPRPDGAYPICLLSRVAPDSEELPESVEVPFDRIRPMHVTTVAGPADYGRVGLGLDGRPLPGGAAGGAEGGAAGNGAGAGAGAGEAGSGSPGEVIEFPSVEESADLALRIILSAPGFQRLDPARQRFAADLIASRRPVFEAELRRIREGRPPGYVLGPHDMREVLARTMSGALGA